MSLVKVLGFTKGATETINKKLGNTVTSHLLELLKRTASAENGHVCVVINEKSLKIVGFAREASAILSNHAYFKLFEDVMNNNKGMSIKNMSVTENGNVEISVLNEDWEFGLDGLSDEFFKSGLVFINSPSKTVVNPFNERLVCTNGMVVDQSSMSIVLNAGPNGLNTFYDTVRNITGVHNFEVEFKERIVRMMKTQASYAELLNVRSAVEYNVLDMNVQAVRDTVESFIPTAEVKRAFISKNIDLNLVSNKAKKSIRTPLTVWELVNKLTDLASHPDRYSLSLRNGNASITNLQMTAGQLSFKNEYDLEETVIQLF
jgi:hypothetical protein